MNIEMDRSSENPVILEVANIESRISFDFDMESAAGAVVALPMSSYIVTGNHWDWSFKITDIHMNNWNVGI